MVYYYSVDLPFDILACFQGALKQASIVTLVLSGGRHGHPLSSLTRCFKEVLRGIRMISRSSDNHWNIERKISQILFCQHRVLHLVNLNNKLYVYMKNIIHLFSVTEIYHKNSINNQDKLEGYKIKHYGHIVSSFPTIRKFG